MKTLRAFFEVQNGEQDEVRKTLLSFGLFIAFIGVVIILFAWLGEYYSYTLNP